MIWNEEAFESGDQTTGRGREGLPGLARGGDSPYMAFEQLQLLATSETSSRRPTGVRRSSLDYPRFVTTKVVAKSADVLPQIARTNSGDLARRRLRPYRCGNLPASGERPKISIWLYAGKLYGALDLRRSPDCTYRRIGFEWLCPCSRSRSDPCALEALRLSFCYTEFSHSTLEVSEWRRHRHDY